MAANQYFQFRQFRIEQDRCAMKVCTDACVFGALIEPGNAATVLDIGTGTGLLSLMIAQRSPEATIHSVEIDATTASQAAENFSASPFSGRLRVYHQRIQDFAQGLLGPGYDLVCCNPPFFDQCIPSKDPARKMARHTDTLSFDELAKAVTLVMAPHGFFYVHIPQNFEHPLVESLTTQGLKVLERTTLQHNKNKPVTRVMMKVSFSHQPETQSIIKQDQLILRTTDPDQYDDRIIKMLAPFYPSLPMTGSPH